MVKMGQKMLRSVKFQEGHRRPIALAAIAVAALLLFGCAARTMPFEQPGQSRVVKTGSSSMIYIARTSAGIVVIDLGWITASSRLREELRQLGADSSDIAAVFLTHAHRDHIAAWPLVAPAPFYLGV